MLQYWIVFCLTFLIGTFDQLTRLNGWMVTLLPSTQREGTGECWGGRFNLNLTVISFFWVLNISRAGRSKGSVSVLQCCKWCKTVFTIMLHPKQRNLYDRDIFHVGATRRAY